MFVTWKRLLRKKATFLFYVLRRSDAIKLLLRRTLCSYRVYTFRGNKSSTDDTDKMDSQYLFSHSRKHPLKIKLTR